jgi:membrane associated rhomboid family serine protease
MALLSSFNEDRPVSYFRGYPIYYATIITILYGLGVVLTAVFTAAGISLEPFIFTPERTWFGGQVWTILTCTFVNEIGFFSIFGLLFIYVAAVEIEKYIGTRRFLTLYALVALLPMVVLTGWIFVFGPGLPFFGNTFVATGFFIAFCTLYPHLQWFGVIHLKWLGIASVALGSLMYLMQHQWPNLSVLWLVSGCSFGYIRSLQSGWELPKMPKLFRRQRRPKLRVVPRPRRPVPPSTEVKSAEATEIDQVLDKISKHGLSSLTAQERAMLERAREKLLQKDRGRNG